MTDPVRPARRRRILLWALTASLALNGFFVGVFFTDQFFSERRRGGMIHFETRSIGEHLPQEQREALETSVREALPEFRDGWRELRELRRQINRLAAEPEPDRDAIEERLAEIRRVSSRIQETVQSRVFDEVLSMSPDVRAGLAREDDGAL